MRNKNLTNTREVYSNQIFQQWKNYVANQVLHIAFLSYAGLKLKISKPIFPHDTKNVFSNQVSNFTPWFPRSLDCATPSTCLIKSLFSSIWLRNNTRLRGPHPAPVLPQRYHHLPGATALPRDTSAGCCPQAFRFVSSQRRNPPIKFTCSWPERRPPTFLRCWSQNVFFLVRRHLLSLAMGPNLLLERADSSPSEQLRSPGHRKLPASGATSTSLLAFTLVLPYCLHSVRIPCLFLKINHLPVLDCFLHTLAQTHQAFPLPPRTVAARWRGWPLGICSNITEHFPSAHLCPQWLSFEFT